jgi:hypothetical protein
VDYRGFQRDFAAFGSLEQSGGKGRRKNRYQENPPATLGNGQTDFAFPPSVFIRVKGTKGKNSRNE